MGNTRNTGYLQNIVQYDASNNITLPARLAVTGTVAVNNTTPYDTTQFSLDVNGGLIVKNTGKTAQIALINSNPASGGNAGFVIHTVGGTSSSSYADIQGYYGTSIAGSTVIRLNPLGGNVLIGSLAGTGSRMVVADATGVLSTQAIVTLGDLSGVSTTRTLTINGTTYDLSANRTWTLYTDDISEDGSPVNLWFTNARARAAISVTGSGSYDSATGVITVTGGVTSVNTLTGAVTLTTTNIAEGTNLYYTDARVLAYLGANNYATQSYVGTQINNLVAGAPGLLDTLDELAAALGDDANFATTTATSLGNRLRVDTAAQGLNSTQQSNGRTNLGLGTAALSATGDFVAYRTFGTAANNNTGDFAAASHTHTISNVTGLQTALDGKEPVITAGTTSQYWRGDKSWQTLPVYTLSGLGGQPQLNGTGFVKVSGTTVSYDNSTYLTTGTAASTYQTILTNPVTGSGTNNYIPKFTTTGSTIGNSTIRDDGSFVSMNGLKIDAIGGTAQGINFQQAGPLNFVGSGYSSIGAFGSDSFIFAAYQPTTARTFIFSTSTIPSATARTYNLPASDGTLALISNIPTNLNQLTNGPGYITSYTETSTLANVTARGATTTAAITTGGLTVNTGGSGTWGQFVVNSTSLWGDGSTLYTTIGAGGAAGVMLFNPHVVWNSTNSCAAIRIGRSGGISSGKYYEIGTGANDNFFIAKESLASGTQLNINSSGNATFSGTITASNFSGSSSGTNTGDQTNISGNAATATNVAWSGVTSKPTTISGYGITDAITTSNIGSQSVNYASSAGSSHGIGYDGNAISGMGPISTWDSRPGVGMAGFGISWHTGVSISGYPGYGGVRLYSAGYPTHASSVLRLEASTAVYTYGGLYSDGNAVIHAGNISSQPVVTIQDSAPSGSVGRLWWESDTGKLKVYYGSAWVDAMPIPDSSLLFAKAGGSITGDVSIGQTLTVAGNTLVQGNINAFGDITAYSSSDARLKDNITIIESALEKVSKISGVSFNWNDKQTVYEVGKKDIGVIAQEVEEVLPELVTTRDNGYKAVRYEKIVPLLIEAIKEQQLQIDQLKSLLNGN